MSKVKLNLEDIKYAQNKAAIQSAYQNYLDNKPQADDALFLAVTKFVKGKIEGAIWDLPESVNTADDFAQEAAVTVWEKLSDFKGEAETFYSWLNRISYTRSVDAFNEIKEETDRKAPLFVEADDDSGDMVDNPLMYLGHVIHEHSRELPEFIRGTDLLICKLIHYGYNYKQIGLDLGLEEDTVKKRVERVYQKIEAQNLPQQRAEFLAEQDRLWAEAKGPIVRGNLKSDGPCDDWANWYQGQVAEARAKYGI